MEQNKKRPLWVDLVFSIMNKRKHALWLIGATVLFTFYCVPWSLFLDLPFFHSKLFYVDDWSWLVMMIPILIWYLLALRWMDVNGQWEG